MAIRTPVTDEVIDVHPGDSFSFGIDLTAWLPSGVTASSVGTLSQENDGGAEWEAEDDDNTIESSDIDDLTISGATVNSSTTTNHLEETVAAGHGIVGAVSGGTHGALYYVTIPVTLSNNDVVDVVQRFRVTKGYDV
jgi:hypothetical protein